MDVQVVATSRAWERGTVRSARSQRYIENNKELVESETNGKFFKG